MRICRPRHSRPPSARSSTRCSSPFWRLQNGLRASSSQGNQEKSGQGKAKKVPVPFLHALVPILDGRFLAGLSTVGTQLIRVVVINRTGFRNNPFLYGFFGVGSASRTDFAELMRKDVIIPYFFRERSLTDDLDFSTRPAGDAACRALAK